MRESLGGALYFGWYETVKNILYPMDKEGNRPPVSKLKMVLVGGGSGLLAWTLALPLDVVKTRLQCDGFKR